MNTLTIATSEGLELVRVQIADIDPAVATVTILGALATIKKPRAKRSDAGKSRTKEAV